MASVLCSACPTAAAAASIAAFQRLWPAGSAGASSDAVRPGAVATEGSVGAIPELMLSFIGTVGATLSPPTEIRSPAVARRSELRDLARELAGLGLILRERRLHLRELLYELVLLVGQPGLHAGDLDVHLVDLLLVGRQT